MPFRRTASRLATDAAPRSRASTPRLPAAAHDRPFFLARTGCAARSIPSNVLRRGIVADRVDASMTAAARYCFVAAVAQRSAFAARPLRDTVNAMNAPVDLAHPPAQMLAERIPLEGSGAVDVERQ